MKIIAIEGLDKAGKRDAVAELKRQFERRGLKVVDYAFPSESTPIGTLIQDWNINAQPDPHTFELLQAADKQNAQLLFEACEGFQVDIFLIDRYVHALWANGAVHNESTWLKGLTRHMRMPNAVVYLDVEPEVSLRRAGAEATTRELERLRLVRDTYLASFVASDMPILQVDANVESVFVMNEVTRVAGQLIDLFDFKPVVTG